MTKFVLKDDKSTTTIELWLEKEDAGVVLYGRTNSYSDSDAILRIDDKGIYRYKGQQLPVPTNDNGQILDGEDE